MSTENQFLTAALTAAARGWHVFPLRAGTKRPALHGDSPRRPCPRAGVCADGHLGWEQRATTDPDRIRAAWSTGGFNVGIACGPSGLLVIDLDTVKSPQDVPPDGWNRGGIADGHDVFAAICETAGQPVPFDTHTVATARAGTHLYFRAPAGVALRNSEGGHGNGLGWKVDTRGHGGYVVAAASIVDGKPYTVTDDRDPAALPDWLATRLTPTPPAQVARTPIAVADRLPAYVAAAIEGECDRVAAAHSGAHTRTLFVAAIALGQLVGAHALSPATAEAALHSAARHMVADRCDCTEREVARTIANGLRAGASRPRITPTSRTATVVQPLFAGRGAA